jgi:hypothetical protein
VIAAMQAESVEMRKGIVLAGGDAGSSIAVARA